MFTELLVTVPALFLALAAASKAVDVRGFGTHLTRYGLPRGATTALRWLVPACEAAVAAALAVPTTRAVGAAAGILLLVAFSGALRRGRRLAPDFRCQCIGLDGTGEPVPLALSRNAALVAMLVGAQVIDPTAWLGIEAWLVGAHVISWYLLASAIHGVRQRRAAIASFLPPRGVA